MDRQNRDERRKKFVALVESGVSTAKAAEAVGISPSTGFKWVQPLRIHREANGKAKTVHFARLIPQSASVTQMQIEVAGVSIKVDSSFDEHALARLIRVVRGAQ